MYTYITVYWDTFCWINVPLCDPLWEGKLFLRVSSWKFSDSSFPCGICFQTSIWYLKGRVFPFPREMELHFLQQRHIWMNLPWKWLDHGGRSRRLQDVNGEDVLGCLVPFLVRRDWGCPGEAVPVSLCLWLSCLRHRKAPTPDSDRTCLLELLPGETQLIFSALWEELEDSHGRKCSTENVIYFFFMLPICFGGGWVCGCRLGWVFLALVW